jgi:uncharacterized protein YndB with AHSA1/START domain/DNA-binding transcriptional ArsR family regulator
VGTELRHAGICLHNLEVDADADKVFKALADQTRRYLLDRLHERNGQTLGELCRDLDMARQSATQHLAVLEAANLISTERRGRERLHYLNPVPLQEISERWIHKFERRRLDALSDLKRRLEEHDMADRRAFVYVTFIQATPERVWKALTDADVTAEYWAEHCNVSDWQVGSTWEHQRTDGSAIADLVGTVLEAAPPTRLVITRAGPNEERPGGPGRVTFDIEPHGDIVRLTVTHENLTDDDEHVSVSAGWPSVLANLKTFLETGHVLPQGPWEMYTEMRAARMALNDPK